ncbi:MAG: PilZ domain-containing protein [Candidatus Omnitrophica bacterium]|nr:PilZ domain-containing protein [Candidatus Omnitrophota bacterium]
MKMEKPLSGYRQKPFAIYLFSAIYFLLPFLNFLQLGADLEGSGTHLREILFSPAFLWESFLAFTAAWAIFSVTQVGFFYFIGLSLYIVVMKFYHMQTRSLFEYPMDALAALLWLGTSLGLVLSTLRIPYLNPSVKWWTQSVRYAHFRPGVLSVTGIFFPIVTLDISESGLFLKLDERTDFGNILFNPISDGMEERRSRSISNPFWVSDRIRPAAETYPQKTGEEVTVKIHMIPEAADIFPNQIFETRAVIVWASKPSSPYRYGLGLQFSRSSAAQKKQLKAYARLIKSLFHPKQR